MTPVVNLPPRQEAASGADYFLPIHVRALQLYARPLFLMRLVPIIFFVLCSEVAIACDCAVSPLAYRIQASDAVFLGEIISHGNNSIELRVLETFKGQINTRMIIPAGGSMCDYFVSGIGQPGSRYLVFMTLKDKKLDVNRCLGTAPESKAAKEIMQLRSKALR